ncbi:hypothetical protein Anas_06431 [Armadillidium nasatum]|uniref:Chitin-binding type-2 domain-containing protein n=1 Tax=Armadillidium nasatum TaxID=96803 RepID=A0A5N5TJJ4_9CRUS|nr:hypothetical protein Anas_06431 [Armadillidium nasatum]
MILTMTAQVLCFLLSFYICSNGDLVPSACPGDLCFDQDQCECVL